MNHVNKIDSDNAISNPVRETSNEESDDLNIIEESLTGKLDDAATFSYVALCAVTLAETFPDDEDNVFKIDTIKKISKHINLPEQVKHSALSILSGDGKLFSLPFVTNLKSSLGDISKTIDCILKDLLRIPLIEGTYDSRYRVFLKRLGEHVNVDWYSIQEYEKKVAEFVSHVDKAEDNDNADKKKVAKKRNIKRYALVGAATVVGGTLLGLTGGLAAPLLVSGLSTFVGTSATAIFATTAGTYIIGSLFGAAGAGLGGYKMQRRIGDVQEFAFDAVSVDKDFSLTVAVTGWLTDRERDCIKPWIKMAHSGEQYVLRFETQYLLQVGNGLDYMLSVALTSAASEALKYTVLSGIITAIMWPSAIIAAASIIDNPWSVCMKRAESAGHHLAEVLISRQQGHRPVTLIGYSIGARVIYYCLKELSKRKNTSGIIEDVYLFGAPVTANTNNWSKICSCVAGKIVNGYLQTDWLLKFIYRTTSIQMSIAGLGPIEIDNKKLHNINLDGIVDGHLDYCLKLNDILSFVGIKVKHFTNLESHTLP